MERSGEEEELAHARPESERTIVDSSWTHATREFLASMAAMRADNVCCDVILVSGEDNARIRAHRLVLAARSPWFEALIRRWNDDGGAKDEIRINEVNEAGLEAVVSYCYSGTIDKINGENVSAMLHASQHLQVEPMTNALTTWLEETLNVQSAAVVLAMADKLHIEGLRENTKRFCLDHGSEILADKHFLDMSFAIVTELLESERLIVESELEVLRAVSYWVRHIPSERSSHVVPLLKSAVRLLLLSGDELIVHAEQDPLVQGNKEAHEVVMKALRYTSASPERRVDFLGMPEKPSRRGFKGELYAIGGSDGESALSHMERIGGTQHDLHWDATIPAMPTARNGCCSAVIGEKIYVVGGLDDDEKSLKTLECFDTEAGSWDTLPPMPTARDLAVVAQVGGKLYVAGGCNDDEGTTNVLRSMECYDPETQLWSRLPDMSTARNSAVAAVVEGKMYVIGGEELEELGNDSALKHPECYDPVKAVWTSLPPMPGAMVRADAAVATIGRTIYVIGGYHPDTGSYNEMWCYDTALQEWSSLASMNTPRKGGAAAVMGGKIYIAGGKTVGEGEIGGEISTLNTVECYDPELEEWSEVAPMSTARWFGCFASVGAVEPPYLFEL